MKKFKEFLIALVLLAVVAGLIYYIHERTSTRYSRELVKRMAEISPRGGPPETIEGLRQAIALYEDQIERNVREGAQTGVYWKILAMRLADNRPQALHNEALEALERAIYFNSEDPALFYLTGVSAAMVAKSKVGFSAHDEKEMERYFKLSENSYLRALELDITYTRAMYGLAILYAFELNRAKDAIVQLERYMQIIPGDTSAMFILARAYFMTEDFNRAVEIYDRIAERTKRKEEREEAFKNRDYIIGIMYE